MRRSHNCEPLPNLVVASSIVIVGSGQAHPVMDAWAVMMTGGRDVAPAYTCPFVARRLGRVKYASPRCCCCLSFVCTVALALKDDAENTAYQSTDWLALKCEVESSIGRGACTPAASPDSPCAPLSGNRHGDITLSVLVLGLSTSREPSTPGFAALALESRLLIASLSSS